MKKKAKIYLWLFYLWKFQIPDRFPLIGRNLVVFFGQHPTTPTTNTTKNANHPTSTKNTTPNNTTPQQHYPQQHYPP